MPGLQSLELSNGPITGDNGGDLKDKHGEPGDSYLAGLEDSLLPSRKLRGFLEDNGYSRRKAKIIANLMGGFFSREGIKIPGDPVVSGYSTLSDEDVSESTTRRKDPFRRFRESDLISESDSDQSGTDLGALNSRFESLDSRGHGRSRRERRRIAADFPELEGARCSLEDMNLNINHRLILDPLLQEAIAGRPVENLDSYYESQPRSGERQHQRPHCQCHQRKARETRTYSEAYPDSYTYPYYPYYMNTKSILAGIGASALAMGLVGFSLRK